MNNGKEISTIVCYRVDGKMKCEYLTAETAEEMKKKEKLVYRGKKLKKKNLDNGIFSDWAEKWLREIKTPSGISYSSVVGYCGIVNCLNSRFGETPIKNITLADFQNYINDLATERKDGKPGFSKTSLTNRKKVAKSIFQYARANNVSGVPDFFRMVVIPKDSPGYERRSLTEDEQQMIIDTEHDAQLPAMIMMFSGLRRGELIPLEWSDIDLENAIISINKSVVTIASKPVIKDGGKSKSATRYIPIPPILVEYLKKTKSEKTNESNLVCPDSKGNIYNEGEWQKLWDDYMNILNEKYGYGKRAEKLKARLSMKQLPFIIEPFTAHYLRHTFATLLYLEDVDVVTAKQILGHSTISTTINVYTDFESINRFDLSEKYKEKLKNEFAIGANKQFGFYSPASKMCAFKRNNF